MGTPLERVNVLIARLERLHDTFGIPRPSQTCEKVRYLDVLINSRAPDDDIREQLGALQSSAIKVSVSRRISLSHDEEVEATHRARFHFVSEEAKQHVLAALCSHLPPGSTVVSAVTKTGVATDAHGRISALLGETNFSGTKKTLRLPPSGPAANFSGTKKSAGLPPSGPAGSRVSQLSGFDAVEGKPPASPPRNTMVVKKPPIAHSPSRGTFSTSGPFHPPPLKKAGSDPMFDELPRQRGPLMLTRGASAPVLLVSGHPGLFGEGIVPLPLNVLMKLLMFLDIGEIVTCRRVSLEWKELVGERELWKKLYTQRWGMTGVPASGWIPWKSLYERAHSSGPKKEDEE